jgi:hypothetical protein
LVIELTQQLAVEIQIDHILFRPPDYLASRILTAHADSFSMLVCAILCAIKAVQNIHEPIFAKMIVSLASTYGVFIVSSLLALDPW